jgi:hypothetical protein
MGTRFGLTIAQHCQPSITWSALPDLGLRVAQPVVEPKRARVLDPAVHRQRPSIAFEARNAEVTQDEDLRRGRPSLPPLVRCKPITLAGALRLAPGGRHRASVLRMLARTAVIVLGGLQDGRDQGVRVGRRRPAAAVWTGDDL